jgi:hypothetical protein
MRIGRIPPAGPDSGWPGRAVELGSGMLTRRSLVCQGGAVPTASGTRWCGVVPGEPWTLGLGWCWRVRAQAWDGGGVAVC